MNIQGEYLILDTGEKLKIWKEPTHEEEVKMATDGALTICLKHMARSRGIMPPEDGKAASDYTQIGMVKEVEHALGDYLILPEDRPQIIERVKKEFSYKS
ncbi:MAG: hypothetical protein V1818_02390 [Candidatus Aenigmatarchaeota archaeon]